VYCLAEHRDSVGDAAEGNDDPEAVGPPAGFAAAFGGGRKRRFHRPARAGKDQFRPKPDQLDYFSTSFVDLLYRFLATSTNYLILSRPLWDCKLTSCSAGESLIIISLGISFVFPCVECNDNLSRLAFCIEIYYRALYPVVG